MREINFVNADEMTTLEEYGGALLSSLVSLKTLESFHLAAFNKGLLDEDESETGKTMCWEIQRLLALYKTQIEHVLQRTEINADEIINQLRRMMPNVEIPKKARKRKGGKKELSEATES